MTGLRLEVDLKKIGDNASQLVNRCARRQIAVTGVTKVLLGSIELAQVLVDAGVGAIGDSRIGNIEHMRHAGIDGPMMLLRSPSPSQIERTVRTDAMTANTEIAVLAALGDEANRQRRIHDVMLMVELGDLREGLMPDQMDEAVRCVGAHPGLRLRGIGTNLACRNGVEPTTENMGELSTLVDSIEERFGIGIDVVSGGNSANLGWALGHNRTGRVNNLRLGESIVLGLDPVHRTPIRGLHTDAVLLVAEAIESQHKPSKPWGRRSENAFGETPDEHDHGDVWQTIFAVGRQDTDPEDLTPPAAISIVGASSDHLITHTDRRMAPGEPVRFRPGYSALLRSATSPFVSTVFPVPSTTSFDRRALA